MTKLQLKNLIAALQKSSDELDALKVVKYMPNPHLLESAIDRKVATEEARILDETSTMIKEAFVAMAAGQPCPRCHGSGRA